MIVCIMMYKSLCVFDVNFMAFVFIFKKLKSVNVHTVMQFIMGIKGLCTYFKTHASPRSIQQVSLRDLEHKTIAIDASIYIYKFLEDGRLLENMYTFVTQLLDAGVTPLFVFDGKPGEEKKDICMARYHRKVQACEKFNELQTSFQAQCDSMTEEERDTWTAKMNRCKKRGMRIKARHLEQLKELVEGMGVYHCEAPSEADVVCAYFVQKNIAYACASDDMDLFAYGCPRVLREWNGRKLSWSLYDCERLLQQDIGIAPTHCRDVLVLAGNDYTKKEHTNVETVIEWYRNYVASETDQMLYDWLHCQNILTSAKRTDLERISSLYDVPDHMVLHRPYQKHKDNAMNKSALERLLSVYGYIFIR